jgi:exosortase
MASASLGTRAGAALFLSVVAAAVLFPRPLANLITLAAGDEHHTHILLIPPLCLALLFLESRRIFAGTPQPSIPLSMAFLAASGILALLAARNTGPSQALTTSISALVLLWLAIFAAFFGFRCLRAAVVPVLLLFLFVPFTPSWLQAIEGALQRSSAEAVDVFFRVSGAPVYREGLFFLLPNVRIEVAPECSGYRSSFALLIAAASIGYLCLRSSVSALLLAAIAIPLMVVKNAVRIFTLAMLGTYVSRNYLEGDLHHRGGMVFLLFTMLLLIPPLWALRRIEQRRHAAQASADA